MTKRRRLTIDTTPFNLLAAAPPTKKRKLSAETVPVPGEHDADNDVVDVASDSDNDMSSDEIDLPTVATEISTPSINDECEADLDYDDFINDDDDFEEADTLLHAIENEGLSLAVREDTD